MPKIINRPLMPEKIEDMRKGVIYKDKWGMLHVVSNCEYCGVLVAPRLRKGLVVSTRCKLCGNKDRHKFTEPILPENINDMKEGVIYYKKRGKSSTHYMLHHCESCGKARVVQIKKGIPIHTRCRLCGIRDDKTREKISKAHLSIDCEDRSIGGIYHKGRYLYTQNRCLKCGKLREVRVENGVPKSLICYDCSIHMSKPSSENTRRKNRELLIENWKDSEWREKRTQELVNGRNNMSEERKSELSNKQSIASKERWSDPEYKSRIIDATFRGLALRPTKPEALLDTLLQEYFTDMWAYNGDNSCHFKVDGKVPDFLSFTEVPMIIEMFSYHHCPALFRKVDYKRTMVGTLELYKKYGYKCLIIWEPELKKPEAVVQKVKEFMQAS